MKVGYSITQVADCTGNQQAAPGVLYMAAETF